MENDIIKSKAIIDSEKVKIMVKEIETYMNRISGSIFAPKLEFAKGKKESKFEK